MLVQSQIQALLLHPRAGKHVGTSLFLGGCGDLGSTWARVVGVVRGQINDLLDHRLKKPFVSLLKFARYVPRFVECLTHWSRAWGIFCCSG